MGWGGGGGGGPPPEGQGRPRIAQGTTPRVVKISLPSAGWWRRCRRGECDEGTFQRRGSTAGRGEIDKLNPRSTTRTKDNRATRLTQRAARVIAAGRSGPPVLKGRDAHWSTRCGLAGREGRVAREGCPRGDGRALVFRWRELTKVPIAKGDWADPGRGRGCPGSGRSREWPGCGPRVRPLPRLARRQDGGS